MTKKQELYNRICRVLTNYANVEYESAQEANIDFYELLVDIQNN